MTYQATIQVEAVQWTGDNFEEIKAKMPGVSFRYFPERNYFAFRNESGVEYWEVYKGEWLIYSSLYKATLLSSDEFSNMFPNITQDLL